MPKPPEGYQWELTAHPTSASHVLLKLAPRADGFVIERNIPIAGEMDRSIADTARYMVQEHRRQFIQNAVENEGRVIIT